MLNFRLKSKIFHDPRAWTHYEKFVHMYAKKRPKGEYYDVILFEDDGSVFVLSFITRQKSGWKE